MNTLQAATFRFAQACDGDPVKSTFTVILFWICFNVLERSIEELIWGKGFLHILDPFFASVIIGYAAYAVYYCAIFNYHKEMDRRKA